MKAYDILCTANTNKWKNKTENYLVKACKNLKEANKILDEDQDPNCITYITDDKGNLY